MGSPAQAPGAEQGEQAQGAVPLHSVSLCSPAGPEAGGETPGTAAPSAGTDESRLGRGPGEEPRRAASAPRHVRTPLRAAQLSGFQKTLGCSFGDRPPFSEGARAAVTFQGRPTS